MKLYLISRSFSNNIKYTNRPFSLEMFKLNPEIKIENSPQSLGILKRYFIE